MDARKYLEFRQAQSKFASASCSTAQPNSQMSFQCLCCRDYGTIPHWVISRYLDDVETTLLGSAATPFQCSRQTCRTRIIHAGYRQLPPDQCDEMHQQELKRWRESAAANNNLNQSIAELVNERSMGGESNGMA